MTINPIKFLKKSEKVRVMMVSRNGSAFRFGTMYREGEFVKDPGKDRAYGPLRLRPLYDTDGNPAYIMHEETGAALEGEMSSESVDVALNDVWEHRPVHDEKGRPVFVFDEETGKPVAVRIDQKVLTLKSDPEMMWNLTDKELLKNILGLEPRIGMLVLTAIASFFIGIVIAGAM